MKCPFCDNECQAITNQFGGLTHVCNQTDHIYETCFDAMDGTIEVLKVGDKIYYGHEAANVKQR